MADHKTIVGHRKQVSVLAQAIKSGKMFPVWMFFGPKGIGKFTVAKLFARYLLNDVIPAGDVLCTNDDLGQSIDVHPDFFVSTDSSMDDIRNLLNQVEKTPSVSKRRVVIIDNAENLNKNSCNALLKTLEEPPRDAVFILVGVNMGWIPITLLSRAMKLYFSPLQENEVEEVLSSSGISDSRSLAKIADGSVGNALYINENGGVDLYNNILQGFASSYEDSHKVVKDIISNDMSQNFKLIKGLLIRAMKTYIDSITQVNVHEAFAKFINQVSVDAEIEKVLRIISDLNLGEKLLLDKNGMIAGVFEVFFERDVR